MAVEVVARKWGNSVGVILPKELHISENDRLIIQIMKIPDYKKIFGIIKRTESGQKFKNEAKKGWEK